MKPACPSLARVRARTAAGATLALSLATCEPPGPPPAPERFAPAADRGTPRIDEELAVAPAPPRESAGPQAWQAALDDACGPAPAADPLALPRLACATRLGDAALAARPARSSERRRAPLDDAPQADRAAFRSWFERRERLHDAVAEGCGFALDDPACGPLLADLRARDAGRPIACRVLGAWTMPPSPDEGSPRGDRIACATDDGAAIVIEASDVDRDATFGAELSTTISRDGLAGALRVGGAEALEPERGAHLATTIELTRWSALGRLTAHDGRAARSMARLVATGLTRTAAASLLATGPVWVARVERGGDASPAVRITAPPTPAATSATGAASASDGDACPDKECLTDRERWATALRDAERRWPGAAHLLGAPAPLVALPFAPVIERSATGTWHASRRPMRGNAAVDFFMRRVGELGGFDPLRCTVDDVVEAPWPRRLAGRVEVARAAGVERAELREWRVSCRDGDASSTASFVAHVPSHLVWLEGASAPDASGAFRVAAAHADPTAHLGEALRPLRERGFVELARGARLVLAGYTHVWRRDDGWHVAFEPPCPDIGLPCPTSSRGALPSIAVPEDLRADEPLRCPLLDVSAPAPPVTGSGAPLAR